MGDSYKRQMEQRCYSRSPEVAEAPVCTRSEKCEGCPFPATRLVATSEVVAEMMEPMLTDTDAIARISDNLRQQDKGLWEKIKDWLQGLVEKLKNAYKDLTPGSTIAQQTRSIVVQSEEILNAWVEAATDAVVNYNLQDGQKNNTPGGVQYSQRYSYEYFVNKPDMEITVIDPNVSVDRKTVKSMGVQSAKKAGRINKYGAAEVYVTDIGKSVVITKDSIGHGLRRNNKGSATENYIVAANAGEIIKNSIKINEMTPKYDKFNQSYILLGVAKDTQGTTYVVESVVNTASNELVSMDILYSMNAKKEPAALNAPGATNDSLPVTGSKIRISSVLDLVNKYFPEILPEEVLRHYGHSERPEGTFGESMLYSSRNVRDAEYMAAVEGGDMETAQRMVDQAAKEAGYTKLFYHGSKKGGGFTMFRDWQYFTENKAYAKRYTERGKEKSLYTTYVKMEKPFDTRLDDVRQLFEDAHMEYGMGQLQENGLPDWTDGYDIADYIDENDLDFDSILLDEGGDLDEHGNPVSRGLSYVIRKSNQIKYADPVTYDDGGNVIPLSQRFDSEAEDIRFSQRSAAQLERENEKLRRDLEFNSMAKNFADEIERWNSEGRDQGQSFILGSTGEVLQGLGAIESDIYMNGDKITTIMQEHPEITLQEIKQIPQILNDPVLILKSRNVGRTGQNTRMTLFGSVKGTNGQPVMAVFDLRPTENHFVINDMQKVTSAYTKTTDAVRFVQSSYVMYADKKRATSLLRSIGFQMPIELLQSGFTGSITYRQRSVNLYGENFSDVFAEGAEILHSERGRMDDYQRQLETMEGSEKTQAKMEGWRKTEERGKLQRNNTAAQERLDMVHSALETAQHHILQWDEEMIRQLVHTLKVSPKTA